MFRQESIAHPQASEANRNSRLIAWASRHQLLAFFGMAFIVTWSIWIPLALGQNGVGVFAYSLPFDFVSSLAVALGLTGSALLLTAVVGGRHALEQFLRAFLQWRIGWRWYLFISLPTLFLLVIGVATGLVSADRLFANLPAVLVTYVALALEVLLLGQLWEEPGWRGFALPRLQPRVGPLLASVILGVMQGVWHAPSWFFQVGLTGQPMSLDIESFAALLISTVFAAIILGVIATWLYNSTRGSLLAVILFHTSITAGNRLIATLVPEPSMMLQVSSVASLIWLVVAIALVVVTRGKLGYKPGDGAQSVQIPQAVDSTDGPVAYAQELASTGSLSTSSDRPNVTAQPHL
jgi:membrane protease YdiL (CAAX protease family)